MNRFRHRAALAALGLLFSLYTEVSAQGFSPGTVSSGSYASEYTTLQTAFWRSSLPNLNGYQVIGPTTGRTGPGAYNCFAHTIGAMGWVWPGYDIAGYDNLYGANGFQRLSTFDTNYTPNQDKIVIYGKYKNGQLEVTHGSKQVGFSLWTSKLGSGPLIRHSSLESLSGPAYGSPIAVYARNKPGAFAAPPAAGNIQPQWQTQRQWQTQTQAPTQTQPQWQPQRRTIYQQPQQQLRSWR